MIQTFYLQKMFFGKNVFNYINHMRYPDKDYINHMRYPVKEDEQQSTSKKEDVQW